MTEENTLPLLSFEPGSLPPIRERNASDYDLGDESSGHPRRWYHYVPLCSELHIFFSVFGSSLS